MTTPPNREIEALAHKALADDWHPNIRAVAHDLARAVLQLAARVEKMERVCEAARDLASRRSALGDARSIVFEEHCASRDDMPYRALLAVDAAVVLVHRLAALTPTTTEET